MSRRSNLSKWATALVVLCKATPSAGNPTTQEPAVTPPSEGATAASNPGQSQSTEAPMDARGTWRIGLGLGVSVPFGKLTSTTAMQDQVSPGPLFAVKIGYALSVRWSLAFQMSFGVGLNDSPLCPMGLTCKNPIMGAAALGARFHPDPIGTISPWIGLAPTLDATQSSAVQEHNDTILGTQSAPSDHWTQTFIGPAILFEAGADKHLSRHWDIGLFTSLSVGTFLSHSVSASSGLTTSGASVSPGGSKSTHFWYGLGIQGAYVP